MFSKTEVLKEIYRLRPEYEGVIEDFVNFYFLEWMKEFKNMFESGGNLLENVAWVFIDEFGET